MLNSFQEGVLIICCVNMIAVLGMSVLTGFTRLFSFGNAGFMSIGAYAAAMNGCDIIVFTAGVGENQASMREEVCKNLTYLGVEIDVEKNKGIHEFVKELLLMYRKYPALYEIDNSWDGFEWINADDADRSIYSFVRKSKDGKNNMLFVCNFTPVARPDYRVGVPKKKTYKLVLDSDAAEFGGEGTEKSVSYKAVKSECDGREFSFAYPLSGYGVAVFKY